MSFVSRATNRIDWADHKDRIDLARVATNLLGPAPGRRGEKGRRLWWCCPFHDDPNPSFCVDPDKGSWRCYGCGEYGDAANLVMRLERLTFPEAVARLVEGTSSRPVPRRGPSTPARPVRAPSGLPEAEARALVEESAARLWSAEGAEVLAPLATERHLSLDVIRTARLGFTPGTRIPTKDGETYSVEGIVIPWFDDDRLSLVKVRQPDGRKLRYAEAFRDRPGLFPGPGAVVPGRPLVLVEGEFDALMLGQRLKGMASVVTLGSTGSTKPDPEILARMIRGNPWFIATDGDDAGNRAAGRWQGARSRRVGPPEPFKDWTEAARAGVDLRIFWAETLGVPFGPYSWEELAGWRWGTPEDMGSGIIID